MREMARTFERQVVGSTLLPLEVRGLGYRAGDKRLIDGLELRLSNRGITVVMGHNGAGKSLLLRLLHGLLSPSEGKILWGGTPVSEATTMRQSMVFQSPVLLRRSVAANVDFVLRNRGITVSRRTELLKKVGLADRQHQPARALSGGEAQRLALARALATGPEVLLLDEPTASLDPASVEAIEEIVRDAARAGTCVIFVTHDIAQARRLADEVVLMSAGRVAETGPTEEFFRSPRTDAARAFLAHRFSLVTDDPQGETK